MPDSRQHALGVRLPLSVFGLVGLLHLVGQLVAPDTWSTDVTQSLLMPLLVWVLIAGLREREQSPGRLDRLTLVALVCSWLGDVVPRFFDGDAGFLAMVGCFFLAQIAYVAAFLPYRRRSLAWRRPLALAPYALALVALLVLCRQDAGSLLGPVVGYGLALTAMAVLATGPATPAGLGGAVFFLSDALIALGAFGGLELPAGHDVWVMLTYIVGQALLVLGVLGTRDSPRESTVRPDRLAENG